MSSTGEDALLSSSRLTPGDKKKVVVSILVYSAMLAAFGLAAGLMRYRDGVPYVASEYHGMTAEDIARARACGAGWVTTGFRCEDADAPVASWLAYAPAVHIHGPPALLSLVIGVLNLNLERGTPFHIWAGRCYAVFVCISAPSAVFLAVHTTGGAVTCVGYVVLAALWLWTMVAGVVAIRRKWDEARVRKHRQWMCRNYALTFAAFTIRLWYKVLVLFLPTHMHAYAAAAWVGWLPNLMVAEAYVRAYPTTPTHFPTLGWLPSVLVGTRRGA